MKIIPNRHYEREERVNAHNRKIDIEIIILPISIAHPFSLPKFAKKLYFWHQTDG